MKRKKHTIIIVGLGAVMVLLLSVLLPVTAAETRSEDWYYEQANDALRAENYTRALELLQEAKEQYSHTAVFNIMLADLYYGKELYTNALEEYLAAEHKQPTDTYVLNQAAMCYGLLNREQDALAYYKKILEIEPDNTDTMDWMGWVYQKTYQLKAGEALLLKAIDRFGLHPRLAGTLASIYADLYEYDKSKYYYNKAITLSLQENKTTAAAIYYYNLSILEKTFYHFALSFAACQNAIDLQEWASGKRMKGTLLHMRMDYRAARREYENADLYDDSAYSKINLAALDKDFGNLEAARARVLDILSQKELSWLLYYSTNTNEYFERLYDLLAGIYLGLAEKEWHTPRAGFLEELGGLVQWAIYRLQAWYYGEKYKLAAIATGRAYLEEENRLQAYLEFMDANRDYPDVALGYCRSAERIETGVNPNSVSTYLMLRGEITSSAALLGKALGGFDSYWQKDMISRTLQSLVPLLGREGKNRERRTAINRLYRINPGGLIQYGFGLPLELSITVDNASVRGQARSYFSDMLRKAGSEITGGVDGGTEGNTGFEYRLALHWQKDGRLRFTLSRTADDKPVRSGIITPAQGSLQARCAGLMRHLLFDYIYAVH